MHGAPKEETLASLFASQHGLRMTCACRGTVRVMSPAEACGSYGALLRFSEVRAVLKARCKARDCKMIVEPTAWPYRQYNGDGERKAPKAS
jgi:hypothetical protein